MVYYLRPNTAKDILPSHLLKETLHIIRSMLLLFLLGPRAAFQLLTNMLLCSLLSKRKIVIQMFFLVIAQNLNYCIPFLDNPDVCEEF